MGKTTERRRSILLVGVGGQGLLTAAGILGEAAQASGMRVAVGQLHGLSQRGGSVECTVVLGGARSSHVGRADVLVGFEPLEALRALPRIARKTRVLLDTNPIPPPSLVRERGAYPPVERIVEDLRAAAREVAAVDGRGVVAGIGAPRALNVFLIGALSGLGWIPIAEDRLREAVSRDSRPAHLDANLRAFDLGRNATAGVAG